MDTETALPIDEQSQAGAPQEATTSEQQPTEGQQDPQQEKQEPPEISPQERELRRLRKNEARLLRQRAQALAELDQYRQQVAYTSPKTSDTTPAADDDQPVTLTRAQIRQLATEEAKRIAPTLQQEEAAEKQRRGVVDGLAEKWGQERFDALARDLDSAFDGLRSTQGKPKPAVDVIFESDMPADLIEYLADPENADEAEALARMNDRQAARAVVKLEAKLQAKAAEAKAKAKPQASSAAPPLEAPRSSGTTAAMPSDSDSIDVWVKKERERMAKQRK